MLPTPDNIAPGVIWARKPNKVVIRGALIAGVVAIIKPSGGHPQAWLAVWDSSNTGDRGIW